MHGVSYKRALKIRTGKNVRTEDQLAVEEPLEIQLWDQQTERFSPLSVTMRTPGSDQELALGFLFAEGIIGKSEDVCQLEQVSRNLLQITLSSRLANDRPEAGRHFYSSSSCGLCGKKSISHIRTYSCYFPAKGRPKVDIALIQGLPEVLLNTQSLFRLTGGIHAAALFGSGGKLELVREDVGRHNALDKLIGACLDRSLLPWREKILLLSGRLSFELIQKASMVGAPIVAAVGAPSSLAVELAEECGMTLLGFVRSDRSNIYCGEERLLNLTFKPN